MVRSHSDSEERVGGIFGRNRAQNGVPRLYQFLCEFRMRVKLFTGHGQNQFAHLGIPRVLCGLGEHVHAQLNVLGLLRVANRDGEVLSPKILCDLCLNRLVRIAIHGPLECHVDGPPTAEKPIGVLFGRQ